MFVRMLEQQELLPALHLVWEVFVQDVAPAYVPEGVAEFQDFIKYDNISRKYQQKELYFFGVMEQNALRGVAALGSNGQIALFFVKKEYQRQGVGRAIFQTMCGFCIQSLGIPCIKVNAVPGALETFQKLGMQQSGEGQTVNGIRFVPMMLPLTGSQRQGMNEGKRPNNTKRVGLIIGVVAGIVLLFILFMFSIVHITKDIIVDVNENRTGIYTPDRGNESGDPTVPGQNDGTQDSGVVELDGLAAIVEYRADGLKYEVEEEQYAYTSEDTKTTSIQFGVRYPKISGLDGSVQDKVNAALKDCAMETVDQIYLNPSMETKESIMREQYPVLASFVEYKVSFQNQDFISVVFQDYNCRGSQESLKISLRTRNISLKDGTVYEVKDIIKPEPDFITNWITVMRGEANSQQLLSELNEKEMKEVLLGNDKNNIYYDNFFVDAEGLEIGLGLEYAADDPNNLGFSWVTAPYTPQDLEAYKTNAEFWEEIKK